MVGVGRVTTNYLTYLFVFHKLVRVFWLVKAQAQVQRQQAKTSSLSFCLQCAVNQAKRKSNNQYYADFERIEQQLDEVK